MFTHVARFNPYKPYPECIEDKFGCGHIDGIEYQPYPECLEDHLGCDPCDYNCRKGVEEMIEAEEKKMKAMKVRWFILTLIYLYPLPFWLKYKWDKMQTTESSDTKKWHHGIFNALKDDKEKEVCLVCLVLPATGWAALYGIGCKAVCCGNRSDCASDFFCCLMPTAIFFAFSSGLLIYTFEKSIWISYNWVFTFYLILVFLTWLQRCLMISKFRIEEEWCQSFVYTCFFPICAFQQQALEVKFRNKSQGVQEV